VRPRTLQEAKEEFGRYVAVATTQDESLPQLLIDAYHSCQKGGTGQRVDPAVARWLARRCCLLLAGGLTPDNVGDAIAQIRPWGVDVSSGVEHAKGIKDHLLVRAFARAVRMADGARDGEPQGGRAENGSAGNERRHAVDLR
jgi:phosphoribosylanthranilate isomerase